MVPSGENRLKPLHGQVHHKTMSLLGSWIAWRLGKQYPRYRSWPEIGLQREVQGIAITYKPVLAPGRSTSRRENWEVEEMGWAFLSLDAWKQVVIWN